MPINEDSPCKNVKWKIKPSKYEFKDREAQDKWRNFIKYVEDNKPLQPSRCSSVVKDLLPASIYDRISGIVDLDPLGKEERLKKALSFEIFNEDSHTSLYEKKVKHCFRSSARHPSVFKPPSSSSSSTSLRFSSSSESFTSKLDTKPGSKLEQLVAEGETLSAKLTSTPLRSLIGAVARSVDSDMRVHPPSINRAGHRKEKPIIIKRGGVPRKKSSPFHNFLCKPRHKAAEAWRPPVTPDIPPGTRVCDYHKYMRGYNLSLLQKEAIITNAIIRDFCDWVNTLGGSEMPQLQENVVRELFELGFDKPVAKSLCIRMRELPVVPDTVARGSHAPNKAIRRGLVTELNADVRAEEKPPKLVGFGRALPLQHRYKPPRNNIRQRWLTVDTVPQDLESMEVVWSGILHLRSTKEFCKYLRENSHLPQPEYLKKMGLLPAKGEKLVTIGERSSIFFPQEMLAPKEVQTPSESSTSSESDIEPMHRATIY